MGDPEPLIIRRPSLSAAHARGGYILRFATQGEIILRLIESELKQGIEVIAVDEGPGIQDVSLAMQEGYLLADDHQIVRQGLKTLLEGEGLAVVAEVADGREAVRSAREPDAAVLDLSMPLVNGLGAAREILRVCPGTRAILPTMRKEDRYVLEALQAASRVTSSRPRPRRISCARSTRCGEA